MALLSGFFGALAALLAMIGLYGVISYIIAMRRNEIGIRMALGASRQDVVGIVLGKTLGLLALGVGVGVSAGGLISRAAGPGTGWRGRFTLEDAGAPPQTRVARGDRSADAVAVRRAIPAVPTYSCSGRSLRSSWFHAAC